VHSDTINNITQSFVYLCLFIAYVTIHAIGQTTDMCRHTLADKGLWAGLVYGVVLWSVSAADVHDCGITVVHCGGIIVGVTWLKLFAHT
jgi:hypothetical protein